ncbi:MAG: radical SAM protein [Oscillospiraceae bacterium]|nr:radical SAM protein [Oscillospiraceae bacterium]
MTEIRRPDAALIKILPPVKPQTDIKYIPSQYALSFEHNGRKYVFNTLTKQCLEAALPESAAAGEGYDELIEAQFLVPGNKDECAYYESISALMRAYSRKKDIRGYTILPTLACNARCIYCYEEGMKQVTMTPEIVERTIDYILETRMKDKSVKLSWFGGEPLMCTDIIDRICEGMRENGVEYKSSMISNGSFITPEIVGKMISDWKLDHIQISMDGAEQDYIKRKNYRDYKGYYTAVMRSCALMSEKGIRVTVRCNVDEENFGNIGKFLDDMKANAGHTENVSVYFAPLNNVRMGGNDLAMWQSINAANTLIDAAGFGVSPFLGIGTGFRTNHCMADGNSVVIAPDGSLFPCEHCPPHSRFGNIFDGITDKAAHDSFCNVGKTREKCRKCPFLPECTSFSNCPVYDTHCREVRELMSRDTLRRMVEKKLKDNEEKDPIC